MVLVLDAVSSNTSTSTANAEYEYEKDKENMDCGFDGLGNRNFERHSTASIGIHRNILSDEILARGRSIFAMHAV
jgi:hypothetical protein